MGKPHKHAAFIKAWADGAEIQAKETGYFAEDDPEWMDTKTPTWHEYIEYRIKPQTIKYRNFVWLTANGRPIVSCVSYEDNNKEPRCELNGFVKWINNWDEVEI